MKGRPGRRRGRAVEATAASGGGRDTWWVWLRGAGLVPGRSGTCAGKERERSVRGGTCVWGRGRSVRGGTVLGRGGETERAGPQDIRQSPAPPPDGSWFGVLHRTLALLLVWERSSYLLYGGELHRR